MSKTNKKDHPNCLAKGNRSCLDSCDPEKGICFSSYVKIPKVEKPDHSKTTPGYAGHNEFHPDDIPHSFTESDYKQFDRCSTCGELKNANLYCSNSFHLPQYETISSNTQTSGKFEIKSHYDIEPVSPSETQFDLPPACVFNLQQIALADDEMVKVPGAAEHYRFIARHILELYTRKPTT